MRHRKVRFQKVLCTLGAVLMSVLVAAPAANANVYASGLDVDKTAFKPSEGETITISYILNENADDNVRIEVYDASDTLVRAEDLGPQAKGPQQWVWDGKDDSATVVPDGTYKFKITASDDGYGAWTQISDDGDMNNVFFNPRGVAVNKNLDSKYLGRIYVSEAGGTAGPTYTTGVGRVTTDGLYILKADHTPAIAQGDTAQSGGVDWAITSGSSPWHVEIGPDDRVYVCDWSDAHAGLWASDDPDFGTAYQVLSNAGQQSSGLATNHGSVSGMFIEGKGADAVVYTVDEDWDDANGIDTRHRGSVLKYAVGNAVEYAEPPEIIYDDNPALILNGAMNILRDSNGDFFISQYRFNGTCPTDLDSIIKVSADGSNVLWQTIADLCGQFDGWGLEITTDPFKLTHTALALDESHDRLYGAGFYDGWVSYIQWSTLDPGTVFGEFLGSSVREMDVDVAGNLYTVDNSAELLRQISPPDGANSFTTPSWFTVTVGEAVVVPPEITEITRLSDTEVQVNWTGDPGKTQTLEGKADLTSPTWTQKATSNGPGSYTEDVTAIGRQFYRVKQE